MNFSNEKEKEKVWIWEEEDKRIWGEGNNNQNILHKKIFLKTQTKVCKNK